MRTLDLNGELTLSCFSSRANIYFFGCCDEAGQGGSHKSFQEIIELMIHGILHLKGYDHEIDEKERELMYSLERTIFEKFKQK